MGTHEKESPSAAKALESWCESVAQGINSEINAITVNKASNAKLSTLIGNLFADLPNIRQTLADASRSVVMVSGKIAEFMLYISGIVLIGGLGLYGTNKARQSWAQSASWVQHQEDTWDPPLKDLVDDDLPVSVDDGSPVYVDDGLPVSGYEEPYSICSTCGEKVYEADVDHLDTYVYINKMKQVARKRNAKGTEFLNLVGTGAVSTATRSNTQR
jgi:hypothetical protein